MPEAHGTIHEYDPDKGQGRILPDGDEEETIPFDEVAEGERIREGDRVTYDVVGGMAGRMAKEVRRIGPPRPGAGG